MQNMSFFNYYFSSFLTLTWDGFVRFESKHETPTTDERWKLRCREKRLERAHSNYAWNYNSINRFSKHRRLNVTLTLFTCQIARFFGHKPRPTCLRTAIPFCTFELYAHNWLSFKPHRSLVFHDIFFGVMEWWIGSFNGHNTFSNELQFV